MMWRLSLCDQRRFIKLGAKCGAQLNLLRAVYRLTLCYRN